MNPCDCQFLPLSHLWFVVKPNQSLWCVHHNYITRVVFPNVSVKVHFNVCYFMY